MNDQYGPNTAAVEAFLERLRTVTAEDLEKLSATRDTACDAAWHAAGDAAWDAARDAAWDAARGAARGTAWGTAWGTARGTARDAAGDVVLALVVQDLISEEHFEKLYGPWREVMG